MSNEQLYIPKTIKVGYQERNDCYTKKLGYVIYYDDKNKLRKETSWKSWIKTDLGDMENVPMEGFVLNRGAGGVRESWGHNARNEYIRVYDPRGFEIEISVSNLLFILQETSSIQGKGLEGEFIYSWSGKELVLLPTCAQDYKASQEYTELQGKKVGARDLQVGCPYLTKKQEDLIYLGRFDWTESSYSSGGYTFGTKKHHIFYSPKATGDRWSPKFIALKSMTSLAQIKSEEQVSNYADLMDEYNKSKYASPAVSLETTDKQIKFPKTEWSPEIDRYWGRRLDGTYFIEETEEIQMFSISEQVDWLEGHGYYNSDNNKRVFKGYKLSVDYTFSIGKDGNVYKNYRYGDDSKLENKTYSKEELVGLGIKQAYAKLKNGSKVKLEKFD